MDLKRLNQVVALLTVNGAATFVRVAGSNTFTVGATVNLTTSGGPNQAGLQIADIKGVSGSADVALYLIDPTNGQPFNATGYTTAQAATVTSPVQNLWLSVGSDETAPFTVFTDIQMAAILASILPGGATAASNVAVTNFPVTQAVSITSSPLPTNAATETTSAAILARLNASVAVTGTFWQATQPISAATLPLPTGAATEATLAAVSGKLPATLGQKVMAGSLSVTVASDQSAVPVSATSLPLPTGAATETTLASALAALQGVLTATVSGTVAVSNFPATQPISAVALPLPTGAATSAAQTDGSQKTQVTNFPATQPISAAALPLPTGAATDASLTNGSQKTGIVGHTVLDTANSTSTPLVGGGSFHAGGAFTDYLNYSTLLSTLFVDQAGTLFIDESTDGVTFVTTTIPVAASADIQTMAHSVDSRYYRVRYTNGATPQGAFRLQTIQSQNGFSGDGTSVGTAIATGMKAQLTKAVISGKTSPGEGNLYREALVDINGALHVAQANTAGVFGGVLMVEETVHSSFKAPFGINTRTCVQTVANLGTVTWAAGVVSLNSNLNAAGSAVLQTREAVRYTPGQGNIARFAPVFGPGTAGNRQAIGFLTVTDGFAFGYNGTQFGVLIRKNTVDTWVPQGSWNGDDKFDGTGPSGETLNPQFGSPMQITMQWLGFGAVRFFIESAVTGEFVLVHTYKYANTSTTPSILQPSLPVRAECVNTGGTTNVALRIASMGGLSEGQKDIPGEDVRFSFTNAVTGVPVGGSYVFSIRNKATNIFGNANTNTIVAHVDILGVRASSTGDMYVQLVLNPTLTGTAYASVDNLNSVMESDVAGAFSSGGIVLATIPVTSNTSVAQPLKDYDVRLIPGDVLMVRAFSETGTINTRVSLSWHEEN